MRILVTGSSGWLGRTLVPRLQGVGHDVIGLDPTPSPLTKVVGSTADRDLVRAMFRELEIEAVVHAGALHKPNIETHTRSEFVATNVQGTLNLLEASVAPGSKVSRFVFTPDLAGSRRTRRRARAAERATLIPSNCAAPARNIYVITSFGRASLPALQ